MTADEKIDNYLQHKEQAEFYLDFVAEHNMHVHRGVMTEDECMEHDGLLIIFGNDGNCETSQRVKDEIALIQGRMRVGFLSACDFMTRANKESSWVLLYDLSDIDNEHWAKIEIKANQMLWAVWSEVCGRSPN